MNGKVKNARLVLFSVVTGTMIGFCYAAGASLDKYDTVDFMSKDYYLRWFMVTVIAAFAVVLIFRGVYKHTLTKDISIKLPQCFTRLAEKHEMFYCAVVLFVCWIPTWLSIFPGAFNYDAINELKQISEGIITSHHPVLHVLFVGGITEGLYRITGSYYPGIWMCTFLQMIILATIYSYVLKFLRERKVHWLFRRFSFLFFAFSPVIHLFAISATKDVLFAAAELLLMVSLLRLLQEEDTFFCNREWKLVFVLSTLLTMILRNNGLYIAIICIIVIFFCVKERKKVLKLLLPVFVCYALYIGPLYSALNVTPGGIEEMLSVPIQQMARVYHYESESIEEEDLELLYSLIPQKHLEDYRSTVSDYVKVGFQREVFEQNKLAFLKLWLKLGVEHPLTYINSFLVGTVDFWYPHAVVDGYKDSYDRSSYFDYRIDTIEEEIVICEKLHDFYEYISWDKQAQRLPGMFLLLSPGWYFVVEFVLFMYLWMHRKYKKMVVMAVIFLNFGTVLLGPVALVRYVLINFYAFPLLFVLAQNSDGSAATKHIP